MTLIYICNVFLEGNGRDRNTTHTASEIPVHGKSFITAPAYRFQVGFHSSKGTTAVVSRACDSTKHTSTYIHAPMHARLVCAMIRSTCFHCLKRAVYCGGRALKGEENTRLSWVSQNNGF